MNPLNPPQNTSKWPRNFATNRIAPIQMVHRSAVTTATSTHSSAAAVIWTCTITDSCRVRTEYSQTIYIEIIMADDDDKTNQKNNQQANKSTILIFIYFMLSIFSQNIMRWPTYGCVTFSQIHGSHHATRIVRTFTNRCAADKATSLIYSPTSVNCDCTIANTMTVCWFSVVMPRQCPCPTAVQYGFMCCWKCLSANTKPAASILSCSKFVFVFARFSATNGYEKMSLPW